MNSIPPASEPHCTRWRIGGPGGALVLGLALSVSPALAHESLHRNIDTLTQELAETPQDASLYLRRAEFYRLHGNWKSASTDIERAAALEPERIDIDFYRGQLLLHSGQLKPALAYLSRYLQRVPDKAPALVARARALVRLGHPQDAVADYSRALKQRPSPELYLERADVLAAAGDEHLELALAGIDEGIAVLGPVPSLELRGIDLEVRRGDVDAALDRVDQALSRARRSEGWLVRRGEILEQAARTEEATRAYRTAYSALQQLPEHRRGTRMLRELATRIEAALQRLSPATSH